MISYLNRVQIESTNLCNLNCAICPRERLAVLKKEMSPKVFDRIIKNLGPVSYVDLTGWGEPLTHRRLFRFLSKLKRKGYKVSLTTNATLLDRQLFKKLFESGLNELAISLDSPTPVEESEHSKDFVTRKIKKLSDLPQIKKVRLQTTLIKDDLKNLKNIVLFAKNCGITKVRLIRLDSRFFEGEIKTINREREKKIFQKISNFAKKNHLRVEMAQYEFGDFPTNILMKAGQKTIFKKICPKLLNSCYVNIDGFVTPCCNLPKLAMGDLKKESLKKIWSGKKFKDFRKVHKDYCGACDILTL